MLCRKPCKSCPWTNENQHNLKFRKGSNKFINLGKPNHKCHVLDSDIWGSKSNIDKNNICIGSLQREIDNLNK